MPYKKREVPYSATDRVQQFLIWLVRLFLVATFIWGGIMQGNKEMAILSVLIIVTTFIPHILFERRYGLGLPVEFHLITTLFLFGSIFIGTAIDAYQNIWWWDLAMHGVAGIGLGFVGFIILYTMYMQKRLDMSFKLMMLFAFCLSLAAGALWEIGEFTSDALFGTSAQRGGNLDSMRDLIADAVGALIMSIGGFFYLRKPGTGPLTRLIISFTRLNPHLYDAHRLDK